MATNMDKKKHCTDLYDIPFVDPEVPANDVLAFSISLFESDYYSGMDPRYFDIYNEVFTKPAIWSAMSFIWNSDLGANGVKFYFHIEDRVFDIVQEYLKECQVPEEYIRKITLPKEYAYNQNINHTQFGKKFMCFYDDDLRVENINIIDSDIFLCVKKEKQAFYRDLTCPTVRNTIAIHEFRHSRWNYRSYMKKVIYGSNVAPRDLMNTGWINSEDMYSGDNMLKPGNIEKFCYEKYDLKYDLFEDISEHNYIVRPFVSANLCQIPTEHPFVKFFKEYGHLCYHEEGLLGMYFTAENIIPVRLDQVLGIPRFLFENDFNEGYDAYLAHYVEAEPNPDHRCYADFYKSMLLMHGHIAAE